MWRTVLIGMAALTILILGSIVAQFLWVVVYHHYSIPIVGIYRGDVRVTLTDFADPQTFLKIQGSKRRGVYFHRPTNFVYKSLELSYAEDGSARTNIVFPGRMSFSSNVGEERLTAKVVREWPYDGAIATNGTEQVEFVLELFEQAGKGTLPRPQHHLHGADEPIHMSMLHGVLGVGFGWTAFAWLFIWIGGLFSYLWARRASAPAEPTVYRNDSKSNEAP